MSPLLGYWLGFGGPGHWSSRVSFLKKRWGTLGAEDADRPGVGLVDGSPEVYRGKSPGQRVSNRRQAGVRDLVRYNVTTPTHDPSWSKPQLAARAHPRSLAVQRALLKLFHQNPSDLVSLSTPLSYCDRLRIRHPGDTRCAIGPHVDGGSVERWEDPVYRSVYAELFEGKWEGFDAWEIGARATANQDMYEGPGNVRRTSLSIQLIGQCHVFRAFQGWTSLSHTGPTEGILQVFPFIKELTAYMLLRPLFKQVGPQRETQADPLQASQTA